MRNVETMSGYTFMTDLKTDPNRPHYCTLPILAGSIMCCTTTSLLSLFSWKCGNDDGDYNDRDDDDDDDDDNDGDGDDDGGGGDMGGCWTVKVQKIGLKIVGS